MKTTTVNVKLSDCYYNIYINDNHFDFSPIKPLLVNRKIAIISNMTVAPLYLNSLRDALLPYNNDTYSLELPDGEEYKKIKTH